MGSKPRWSLLHLFLFPFLTLEEDCVEACGGSVSWGLCEEGREVTEGFQSAVLDGRALGLRNLCSVLQGCACKD